MTFHRFIARVRGLRISQRVICGRCLHQMVNQESSYNVAMNGPKLSPDSPGPETGKSEDHYDLHTPTPDLQGQFSWLGKLTPCFGLNGSQVEIIRDPAVFYKVLLAEASKAKRRIVLASLYLGTSPLEEQLVNSIYKAAEAKKHGPKKDKLSIEVLLDYTRGSRGELNSRTMLMPLLKSFPDQVRVSLFHSPDLRGWRKKWLPERFNEVIGLHHMKIYLFDDNVLLSGANLSESYFTNRQDRYVIFRRCSPLADFFHDLVNCVSSLSFTLAADDTVKLADGLQHHPFEGENYGQSYRDEAQNRLEDLLTRFRKSHNSSIVNSPSCNDSGEQIDTWVYPLLQMGPFGIKLDDYVTQKLLQTGPVGSHIKLASGYFNLTDHYMSTILNDSVTNYSILTASPQANGFFGARGISGAIPAVYTHVAKQFHDLVRGSNQGDRIHIQEYSRDDWTFHGKGLWFYLPHQSLPSMSLVGSPNFGYRSVFRDLEAQVAIVTNNNHLRKQLHLEQNELFGRSTPVTRATFDKPSHRVPLWVAYVTAVIRNFF